MESKPRTSSRVLLLGLICAAAAGGKPSYSQTEPDAGAEYRIGEGDRLDVVVWRNDQLTRRVTVRPDGRISLPLVGEIRAAGRTPLDLQATLASKLADFIAEPEVFVIVEEARSFQVSVLGNVRDPGRFQLHGPTSVLDVLALAGGLDEYSSREEVYLLRRTGGSYQRIPVRYSEATKAGERNIDVAPGDVVIVP